MMKPLNVALAGSLAGGAWALLGWKGIPLIASVPFGVEGQGLRTREGLKTLIIRRRLLVAAGVIFPVLTAGLMIVIPRRFALTAFLLSGIPALVCLFRFVLSACPRCDHYFFVATKLSSISRCQHCNLYLKLERAISNNRSKGSDMRKKHRS